VSVVGQADPVHTFNVHFNMILPSALGGLNRFFPSGFSANIVCIGISVRDAYYMARPSHVP
jgi:hypothetical protein